MSQGPQIEVPYPPLNGGQQHLGTLVAFVRPSVIFIKALHVSDLQHKGQVVQRQERHTLKSSCPKHESSMEIQPTDLEILSRP